MKKYRMMINGKTTINITPVNIFALLPEYPFVSSSLLSIITYFPKIFYIYYELY